MGNVNQQECIIEIADGYYPTYSNIDNVIKYVWLLAYCAPWGAVGVYPLECRAVREAYVYVQEWFGKTDGRRVMHVMLSFPRQSDIQDIEKYVRKITMEIGKRFQVIWGIHVDTPNLHVHMAINSVSFVDGKKLTKEEIREIATY